jgi:hypothetical protein
MGIGRHCQLPVHTEVSSHCLMPTNSLLISNCLQNQFTLCFRYTAHIQYNCFQRFEPGSDTHCKHFLGRTKVVLMEEPVHISSYEHQCDDIAGCAPESPWVHGNVDTYATQLHLGRSLISGSQCSAIHAYSWRSWFTWEDPVRESPTW